MTIITLISFYYPFPPPTHNKIIKNPLPNSLSFLFFDPHPNHETPFLSYPFPSAGAP